jgi:hypothetical protein
MNASIFYIWILWIIAIPLGPFMGWLCQKCWTRLSSFLLRTMLAFFGASITVGLCTIFTPWSFRGFWLQAVNLVLAYNSATCSGGWAGIDWEGVTIVQQPTWLPVLEKRLYSVHIGVAGDCDAASVRVDPDAISHEIRVQCGRQNPYVFARVKMP